VYDRRIGSPPSAGKHGSSAEPRDPWDRPGLGDDDYTTQMPVVKASEDLYVWTDDKDRPRGAPPAAGPSRPGDTQGTGRPSGRGSSSGASGGKSTQNGAGDEPYVVFDPTPPGR
jgi:hypothetical protein